MDKFDAAGVEVSAKVLVLALKSQGQMRSSEFPNTAAGHKQVIRYLRRYSQSVRVCMESTGLYGLDLALALQAEKGLEIMVANPRSVRHFGDAMMKRSKTDPIDAKLLAEYAERMPFHAWQPPSKPARQLCAIARAIHQLTEINTMQKNQLHAAGSTVTTPKIIMKELRRSLAHQERAIERLLKEAMQVLQSDPLLQKRFQLLLGIRGIKELSAVQLLGELVLIPADCDVRQWVAYAGLDPRQYKSGESVERKVRISKAGNRHLRRALFMPALVAVRHDPYFRAFYRQLVGKGKLKMVALVAVMRKLLHGIYGIFKSQQPFDPGKLFPSSSVPVLKPSPKKMAC
jgi:transposase